MPAGLSSEVHGAESQHLVFEIANLGKANVTVPVVLREVGEPLHHALVPRIASLQRGLLRVELDLAVHSAEKTLEVCVEVVGSLGELVERLRHRDKPLHVVKRLYELWNEGPSQRARAEAESVKRLAVEAAQYTIVVGDHGVCQRAGGEDSALGPVKLSAFPVHGPGDPAVEGFHGLVEPASEPVEQLVGGAEVACLCGHLEL